MKKFITFLVCLVAFGGSAYSQTGLFILGGAGTNSFTKKYREFESASMSFAPMAELHFYSQVFNKGKIGIVARYSSINVMEATYTGQTPSGEYIFSDKKKKQIVRNMYTLMMSAGGVYKVSRLSLSPALELGMGFSEKPSCLVMGIRFDANYEITKTIGIVAGISGDYYNLKDGGAFYIPLKAGVSLNF